MSCANFPRWIIWLPRWRSDDPIARRRTRPASVRCSNCSPWMVRAGGPCKSTFALHASHNTDSSRGNFCRLRGRAVLHGPPPTPPFSPIFFCFVLFCFLVWFFLSSLFFRRPPPCRSDLIGEGEPRIWSYIYVYFCFAIIHISFILCVHLRP